VLVMDGPVPPDRWALEDNGAWAERVSHDVLAACVAGSSVCAAALGPEAHAPRLAMDAIIDGTLPCATKLPWLSQWTAAAYTLHLTAFEPAHILLAPFWASVIRCSPDDIKQLNFFNEARRAAEPTGAAPPFYMCVLA
jgi:hypothetical protein